MSCFGSRFLLAKPAGCKVAGCAHPHPFAQVHRLMIQHGLTLEQLAEKSELSSNYIGMVERGLKEPGLATIVKLLNALKTHCCAIWFPVHPM